MEGPSDDPAIVAVRERQKRNFLATLLLSQGVPMISGGDEIGRTQNGNNNAYAQDNATSWYSWDLDQRQKSLLEFTRKLVNIRRSHPNLHRRKFFQDRPIDPGTPLRQDSLAATLGTSRMPLREAIRQLARLGWGRNVRRSVERGLDALHRADVERTHAGGRECLRRSHSRRYLSDFA